MTDADQKRDRDAKEAKELADFRLRMKEREYQREVRRRVVRKFIREHDKPLAIAAFWRFVRAAASDYCCQDGFVEWWLVLQDVDEALDGTDVPVDDNSDSAIPDILEDLLIDTEKKVLR